MRCRGLTVSFISSTSTVDGRAPTDEVLKHGVRNRTTATVALNHVHLVGFPGVDVTVQDVADIGVGSQRAHTTSSTPVAVNVLDDDVSGRTLHY